MLIVRNCGRVAEHAKWEGRHLFPLGVRQREQTTVLLHTFWKVHERSDLAIDPRNMCSQA